MTEEDFNILTRPLHPKMYACAFMMLRYQDSAADCVQDTLLRLGESRSRLAEIEKPEAYCMTAVKRQALDSLRRNGRIPQTVNEIDNVEIPEDLTPHDIAEARDDLALVRKLLTQLAPRQREVVELSAINGLDNSEIAQTTGMSDENVRVLLSRGRSKIRELFRSKSNH